MSYLSMGSGDPLLFLHGWGLSPRTYATALRRLVRAGVRVVAPTLPGFGASARLPWSAVSMPAYAAQVASFVDTLDLGKPAFVMGHSFGGGVALQLAHDRPDLARSLTLLNSVGGSPSRGGTITSRPWWQWAIAAGAEADPRGLLRMRPAHLANLAQGFARDLVPNVVRRPVTLTLTGLLALAADLTEEAEAVMAAGLPTLFVWGDRDRRVLPGAFAELAHVLPPEVVQGRHGWLLTEPDAFGDLLHDALVVHAMLERSRRAGARGLSAVPADGALVPAERRRRGRVSVLHAGSPA